MLPARRENVRATAGADEHVVIAFRISVNFIRRRFITRGFARRSVSVGVTFFAVWRAVGHSDFTRQRFQIARDVSLQRGGFAHDNHQQKHTTCQLGYKKWRVED